MTGARRPFGLTSIDVEAGFRPDLEDVVTNVTATTHPDGNGWSVRGDTTVGTDLVATFTRSIYAGRDGIVAKHIRLDVTPHFQGQGYAKSLLKASFRLYQHIGVAYVELDAVGDGSLVWPRLGWSLHGASIRDVHSEIADVYIARHRSKPPDDFRYRCSAPIF